MRRSLESSLSRLGVDRVDIVHIHDPEDHIDEAIDGAHRALVDLAHGVIGAVSLGTNFVQTAETFLDRGDLDCVLVAGRYTLLDRERAGDPSVRGARRRLPGRRCVQQRRSRPAGGGRGTTTPASASVLDPASHRAGLPASRRGVAGGGVELPVLHPDVSVVIVGMARPHEVDENIDVLRAGIPDDLWTELAGEGLLATTTEEGSQ